MSKGNPKSTQNMPAPLAAKKNGHVPERIKFTASSGIEVTLKPVPQLLVDSARNSVEYPELPYYEIEIGDDVEKHELTEDTLKDEDLTPEERAEFEATLQEYYLTYAKADEQLRDNMMNVMFLRGVEVELPEDDSWAEEQLLFGVKVPESPAARRLHYVKTEVIMNAEDMISMFDGIMRVSGMPEEYLREAQDSFRSAMEEAKQEIKDNLGNS